MHGTYILAETATGIVLVDQHAAHERLVYERMKEALARHGVARQMLLLPEIVELDPALADRLAARAEELAEFGLVLEPFGTGAVIVREVPALVPGLDVRALVRDLADELAEWGDALALRERVESVCGTLACHSSVRAGNRLTPRRDGRALAPDGGDPEQRPMQPRPPDLCRTGSRRYRAPVRAAVGGRYPAPAARLPSPRFVGLIPAGTIAMTWRRAMLEVWSWPTPNGHKVHIALEELGLEYQVIPVNIGAGDQFKPEFLKITRNHRIPAIVDPDGPGGKPFTLFESAAILIYLSEKTGGKLIPKDPIGRYKCLEWMMFQMGGVGPMFGQWNHFGAYAPEKVPYAIERYTNEVKRLTRVLNHRLEEAHWLAGDEYSMADIITFPWIRTAAETGARFAERGSLDSPNIRRSSAGMTRSRRARRCSAASRCWPTSSATARSTTPSARTRSAR